MIKLHRNIAAYLYTELTGGEAEAEIANQGALVAKKIASMGGAQRVATFSDIDVQDDGPLPKGLADLLEAAQLFKFDTVLVTDKHIFIVNEYACNILYACHVAVRMVGEEEIDDDIIARARHAMPFLQVWAWQDERATKMRRREENDTIIRRVYDQTPHLSREGFVDRLEEIARKKGIPVDDEQADVDNEL